MLLVSDYDVVQGGERVLAIAALLVVVIECFTIGLLMLLRRRNKASVVARHVLLGISLFATMFGTGRLFMLYHDYFAADALDMLLYQVGFCFILLGLFALAFTVERFLFTKTRKFISGIGLACILVLVLSYHVKTIAIVAVYVGTVSSTMLLFLVYIHIARTSSGVVRKRALIVIVGFVLVFLGQFGGTIFFNTGLFNRGLSQVFSAMLMIFGLLFVTYGLVKTSHEAE